MTLYCTMNSSYYNGVCIIDKLVLVRMYAQETKELSGLCI